MYSQRTETKPVRRPRIPWLLWRHSKDFEGREVRAADIQQGDTLIKEGKYREALTHFTAINPAGLSGRERRALAFRTAAAQLALNQSDAALATLSQYFASIGLRVKDVEAGPSLFLGYAYGQAGNLEQSMAWFVRAHRLASDNRRMREQVSEAIEQSFASIPPEQFEERVAKWEQELFVDEIVSQERARRAARGYRYAARSLFRIDPYYVEPSATGYMPRPDASNQVLVLLPMSGKYATLGQNVKRGVQLALKGGGTDGITANFVDTGGVAQTALVELEHQIRSGAQPPFVVGPLLSEPAEAVSKQLRKTGIPMLSFSKRNTFETGDGIFRLGVTAESQSERLIEKAHLELGVKSYAIVAPNDYTGYEYADSFREQLATEGLTLAFEGTYQPGDSVSIQGMAEQVEKHKVEGIFFPGSLEDAALFFSSMPVHFRQRVRPIGTVAWDNLTKLRNSQRALDGALFVSPFYEQSDRKLVTTFTEAYKAAFGTAPDFLAAQGFDAATLVLAAVKQGYSQNYSFAQAMIDVGEYEGLTGVLSIGTSGEIRRRYSTLVFEKGNLRELPLRTVIQAGN